MLAQRQDIEALAMLMADRLSLLDETVQLRNAQGATVMEVLGNVVSADPIPLRRRDPRPPAQP
jgi:hypothetical protein